MLNKSKVYNSEMFDSIIKNTKVYDNLTKVQIILYKSNLKDKRS